MRRHLGLPAAAAAVLATIAAPVSTAHASDAVTVGTERENAVVRLVNAHRAKEGCRALKHHRQLHRAARGHAADMAEYRYFSSESRDDRSFTDRLRQAGFKGGTAWAQNIAKGQRTPAIVVRSWMSSPGTKANIMNCKYTLIGVGAAEDSDGSIYWTQMLAAR
ncbi:CAP domain-containing protein [Nonomuraea sp. NPDC050404]|uniref:CAP domain-containing protein n=1 Tax=Nonomuraea sp. NPDC050404 TaxID=3155783 RepID=UPI0033CFED55